MSTDLASIAFVVPTKDRPRELRSMLGSLARQDVDPVQVIVVDASEVSVTVYRQDERSQAFKAWYGDPDNNPHPEDAE